MFLFCINTYNFSHFSSCRNRPYSKPGSLICIIIMINTTRVKAKCISLIVIYLRLDF